MNKKNIVSFRTLKNKITNEEVNIYIHLPLQEDDGTWFCLIEVGEIEKKVYGIDSMQVIILSILAIREVLLNEVSDELEWLDGSSFLGFPLFVPMIFPDFERIEIEKKLQNEVDKTINDAVKKWVER